MLALSSSIALVLVHGRNGVWWLAPRSDCWASGYGRGKLGAKELSVCSSSVMTWRIWAAPGPAVSRCRAHRLRHAKQGLFVQGSLPSLVQSPEWLWEGRIQAGSWPSLSKLGELGLQEDVGE